jgi:hypothetical protein
MATPEITNLTITLKSDTFSSQEASPLPPSPTPILQPDTKVAPIILISKIPDKVTINQLLRSPIPTSPFVGVKTRLREGPSLDTDALENYTTHSKEVGITPLGPRRNQSHSMQDINESLPKTHRSNISSKKDGSDNTMRVLPAEIAPTVVSSFLESLNPRTRGSGHNSKRNSKLNSSRSITGPIRLLGTNEDISITRVDNMLFELAKMKSENPNLGPHCANCKSCKNTPRSGPMRPRAYLKHRFRVAVTVVIACNIFDSCIQNIKKFGTSTNLFNMMFKNKKSVKKALYPNNKVEKARHVVLDIPPYVINPNSDFALIWNIWTLLLILYCITFMPYGMVFLPDDLAKEIFEDI